MSRLLYDIHVSGVCVCVFFFFIFLVSGAWCLFRLSSVFYVELEHESIHTVHTHYPSIYIVQ